MRGEQEHVHDHLRELHDPPRDADVDDEELGDTALEKPADQVAHAVTTLMHDGPAKQRLSQRGDADLQRVGLASSRRTARCTRGRRLGRFPLECYVSLKLTELDWTRTSRHPRGRAGLHGLHRESEPIDPPLLAKAKGKTQEERTALLGDAFIPVDANAGRLLYTLARGCA